MSYTSVIEGLHERFATVIGLKVLLVGEPTSVQDSPLLYSLVERVEREAQATKPGHTLMRVTYRTLHRLCLKWQDNPTAEAELLALADAIPAAIEADPKLGGRITGDAHLSGAEAGWVTIGGTTYRVLDFYSEVLELAPVRGTT